VQAHPVHHTEAIGHVTATVAWQRWDAGAAANHVLGVLMSGLSPAAPEGTAEVLDRPEACVWATPEEAAMMRANGLQLRPAADEAGGGAASGGEGGGGASEWVLSLRPGGDSPETFAPWLGRPLAQADVDDFWRRLGSLLSSSEAGPSGLDVMYEVRRCLVEALRALILSKLGSLRVK
jgi:hypothetical protein